MQDATIPERPLVFLSWSGERARHVANTLSDHIEDLLNVDTFVSPNIEKGEEWNNAIHSALRRCDAGIIILTKENSTAPWLLYEAGAIKTARPEPSRTKTLFVGRRPIDYKGPLQSFMGTTTDRDDFFQLVESLNVSCEVQTTPQSLTRRFEALWPKISQSFEEACQLSIPSSPLPQRSASEMTEEILEIVRDIQKKQPPQSTTLDRKATGPTDPLTEPPPGDKWHLALIPISTSIPTNRPTERVITNGDRIGPISSYQSGVFVIKSKTDRLYVSHGNLCDKWSIVS